MFAVWSKFLDWDGTEVNAAHASAEPKYPVMNQLNQNRAHWKANIEALAGHTLSLANSAAATASCTIINDRAPRSGQTVHPSTATVIAASGSIIQASTIIITTAPRPPFERNRFNRSRFNNSYSSSNSNNYRKHQSLHLPLPPLFLHLLLSFPLVRRTRLCRLRFEQPCLHHYGCACSSVVSETDLAFVRVLAASSSSASDSAFSTCVTRLHPVERRSSRRHQPKIKLYFASLRLSLFSPAFL